MPDFLCVDNHVLKLVQLPEPTLIPLRSAVPSYADHYLFVGRSATPYQYPEHYTGLGVISVLQGRGYFRVNGIQTVVDSQGFLVVNRGSQLSFEFRQGNSHLVILYFNTQLARLVANSQLLRNPIGFSSADLYDYTLIEHVHFMNATLQDYLYLLLDLGKSGASFHSLKSDAVVRSMLDALVAENHDALRVSQNLAVTKTATRVDLYRKLSASRRWVEANYADAIDLEQMADIAMLNRHHFLRLFKKAFATTPHQFLIEIRLEKACNLLRQTDLSVSHICHAVGFDSISSFSGLFKKRLALTPTQYRKIQQG